MPLADLIARLGESAAERTRRVLDSLKAAQVPVHLWTDPRNLGLALSNILGVALAELGIIGKGTIDGQDLETASGEFLTKLAKSQFFLDRYPAVQSEISVLIYSAATSPKYTLSAGDLTVGPEGKTSPLFTSTEDGTIDPSGSLVLRFRCQTPGTVGNILSAAPITLRTAKPGLTVYAQPALYIPGQDVNGGLTFQRAPWGAPNPLYIESISGGGTSVATAGSTITITLGAGATANQVAAAIQAHGTANLWAKVRAQGNGTGLAPLFPSTVLSSPVLFAGQNEEEDGIITPPYALKGRCAARWGTLGYGGSEEALAYWAMQAPPGYVASPVSRVRVYSNRRADGTIAGNHSLVLVAGPAGALTGADVTAIKKNFYNPTKFANGVVFDLITSTNLPVTISGTVYFHRDQIGASELQAQILAKLAEYQKKIPVGGFTGGWLRYDRVLGQIESVSDAIDRVVMTAPVVDQSVGWNQTVTFTVSLSMVPVVPV